MNLGDFDEAFRQIVREEISPFEQRLSALENKVARMDDVKRYEVDQVKSECHREIESLKGDIRMNRRFI
jgi:hypothetical protein